MIAGAAQIESEIAPEKALFLSKKKPRPVRAGQVMGIGRVMVS
jgi:hypothetical protein